MNIEAYDKIFKSANMFEDFFAKKDFVKKILFPVEYFRLSKKQYEALIKTLTFLNLPKKIYEVITEDNNKLIVHDFDMESYEQYELKSNSILENQLFSDSLCWGIGISHEDHAVLGCTNKFYEVFQSFYKQNDKVEFIKYWQNNVDEFDSNVEWLKDYLTYTV